MSLDLPTPARTHATRCRHACPHPWHVHPTVNCNGFMHPTSPLLLCSNCHDIAGTAQMQESLELHPGTQSLELWHQKAAASALPLSWLPILQGAQDCGKCSRSNEHTRTHASTPLPCGAHIPYDLIHRALSQLRIEPWQKGCTSAR